MIFVNVPTELTTSATDALLAIECVIITVYLWRTPTYDRWRTGLWCWVFGLISFSSFLGAITHGFKMPGFVRETLWKPLYLSLGVLVALFIVGAVFDWRGRTAAVRLLPWGIGAGVLFFGMTEYFGGAFIVFDVYVAMAMVITLAIYSFLAATNRVKGSGIVAVAILLNLTAAGVQATDASVRIFFPFDHNGVFHLVQMAGAAALGLGLRIGMRLKAG
jgi:hypothetical protein